MLFSMQQISLIIQKMSAESPELEMQQKGFSQLNEEEQSKERPETDSTSMPRSERNYGNGIVLCQNSNGSPRRMLGPHWYIFVFSLLVCMGFVWFLIYSMRSMLTPFWFYFLSAFSLLFSLAYLNIGTSIPGFASRAEEAEEQAKQDQRYCRKCRIVRIRGTRHCQDCDVCIEGYDHHCPWIGKCVGANNSCGFYFFLIMIFGTLIMCFVATLGSSGKKQHLTKQTSKQVIVLI